MPLPEEDNADSGAQPQPPESRPPDRPDRRAGLNRTLLLALAAMLFGYLIAGRMDWLWRDTGEVKRDFEVMRTFARITIPAGNGSSESTTALADLAERAVREVNDLMGPRGERSDIRRLNASPAGTWVEVNPITWAVVMEALRWNRLSGGAFDPTIGPVKGMFTFDQGELAAWPDAADLARAKSLVGADKLRFDREGMRLSWAVDGMTLDLGAIAKGYAADRAIAVLVSRGVKHAMVDIGGELRLLGGKPDGTPWRAGIRNPRWNHSDPDAALSGRLELADAGIATSGDYENYFTHLGRRYLHIIDPRVGLPLAAGPGVAAGVTVVHPDSCLAADALATTLCVLGPEAGRAFLADQALGLFSRGVKAIMLVPREDDGAMRKITYTVDTKGGLTVEEE